MDSSGEAVFISAGQPPRTSNSETTWFRQRTTANKGSGVVVVQNYSNTMMMNRPFLVCLLLLGFLQICTALPKDEISYSSHDTSSKLGRGDHNEDAPEVKLSENEGLPRYELVMPLHIMGIVAYLFLLCWFSNRMKLVEQDAHNSVEEWIGRTIAVSLCAVVLRCLEYLLYDYTGSRHPVVALVTAFGYGCKHAMTRSLLVALSTGVGVLPYRINMCKTCILVVLTIFYAAFVTILDYWAFIQEEIVENDKDGKHIRLILLACKESIEAIFWFWIMCCLCGTISGLRKLTGPNRTFRYRCLMWLLVVLAGLSFAVFAAVITERTEYGSVGLGSNRILSQIDEVSVFFMLFAVAILWRPRAETPITLGEDVELSVGFEESHPDVPEDSPLFGAVHG